MTRPRLLASVVVVAVVLAATFVAPRRPTTDAHPPTAPTTASVRALPGASAPPAETASVRSWPADPVRYDCSEFAPPAAPSPGPPPTQSDTSVILQRAKLRGASAVLRGAGLPLTAGDCVELEGAMTRTARSSLTPFARATVQNAAIALARCARAAGATSADGVPSVTQLARVKAHARKLVEQVAIDNATLSALGRVSSPLTAWLGIDAEAASAAPRASCPPPPALECERFHPRDSSARHRARRGRLLR